MRICSILRGALVSSLLVFAACDDNTSNLGVEVMPDGDFTISTQTDYPVNITSFAVDSILARTTTAYLGKFTDPYTNTVFESDFLTEFYCPEDFKFPDKSLLADPETRKHAPWSSTCTTLLTSAIRWQHRSWRSMS